MCMTRQCLDRSHRWAANSFVVFQQVNKEVTA